MIVYGPRQTIVCTNEAYWSSGCFDEIQIKIQRFLSWQCTLNMLSGNFRSFCSGLNFSNGDMHFHTFYIDCYRSFIWMPCWMCVVLGDVYACVGVYVSCLLSELRDVEIEDRWSWYFHLILKRLCLIILPSIWLFPTFVFEWVFRSSTMVFYCIRHDRRKIRLDHIGSCKKIPGFHAMRWWNSIPSQSEQRHLGPYKKPSRMIRTIQGPINMISAG